MQTRCPTNTRVLDQPGGALRPPGRGVTREDLLHRDMPRQVRMHHRRGMPACQIRKIYRLTKAQLKSLLRRS
jgi:hypothetical protein